MKKKKDSDEKMSALLDSSMYWLGYDDISSLLRDLL